MLEKYPAKYIDAFGIEDTVIENDGKQLSMTVRGVKFVGSDFDGPDPEPALDVHDSKRSLFTLTQWGLTDYILEFQMSIAVTHGTETLICPLDVHLKFGTLPCFEGIDENARVQLKLHLHDQIIISTGKSAWIESEIFNLQNQLPAGHNLKSCLLCEFSEYYPAGHGLFGGLACFRDNKAAFLKVSNKGELFQIWDTHTDYVQETYRCEEFQFKRGYERP